jgi:putative membrane-bound dehydrogenase-like protein
MKPVTVFAAVLALASFAVRSAEFKLGPHNFTVPDGFIVEEAAGPGLVDRPIVADFDEQGRLYVAESSGSNDPVAKQVVEKPHRIVRLEDTDGDGRFDKSLVFADKMMFPEGAMWHAGSLYVSAPPIIWKLTDTNNDGVADKREEWLDAKTLTGCANDLHGPYLGLDGWIYWCKGAFAEQTYERSGSAPFVTRAAHIFRRRPEGGLIEPVMTGGMDNPVEVAFTPEGERIFTTTFFQHPGGGQRDGLVHAIYGGVYGKVHSVIDDHKKTGDLMPVLTQLGPAAPAGLTRYESEIFGKEYRDNLFAALFNLHKVTRHVLKPSGASYATENSDFIASDNTDFHPTDVLEDADGSLLVINTGGWYKLCCPTSQLWKPDVLGAIYRIRRNGAPKVADPRGAKIIWARLTPEDLAKLLGDSRPAVVRRAIQHIRANSESAGGLVSILHQANASERQKIHAVWALASNQDQKQSRLLQDVLGEYRSQNPPSVRHAALHALSVTPERVKVAAIAPLLSESESPAVRRAAAEVLGRTRDISAVPALLEAAGRLEPSGSNGLPDRVQEHSIIYALIESNAAGKTRAGLHSTNSLIRRAALIAIDQMDSTALKPADVIPLLESKDAILKQTANWIIPHRKDWGADLTLYFSDRLKNETASAERSAIVDQLVKLAGSPAIQEFVAKQASDPQTAAPSKEALLRIMSRSGLKETPASWVQAVISILKTPEPSSVKEAVTAAAAFPFKQFSDELKSELIAVAHSESASPEIRLEALAATSGGAKLDSSTFQFVRSHLTPSAEPSTRRFAMAILSKATLTPEQLLILCSDLKQAGPLEMGQLLSIYEKAQDEKVGQELLAVLKEVPGIASLTFDQVQRTFAKYPDAIKDRAKEIFARLNVDATEQSARIEQLLPKLQGGDVRRGQAIFNSTKAACSSCHAIGYLGGDLGPDLTRIGQVRTERDLVEAIVYPSASFVRSYEPMIFSTRDGEEYSGVLRKDAADEVILGTGPGAQVRLARADIVTSRPGKVSVMPQGLDQQLSTQDLADLLAFLKATRW